jgi:hypothetical protein
MRVRNSTDWCGSTIVFVTPTTTGSPVNGVPRADMAAFSLVLRSRFARRGKGENLTCDLYLTMAPTS